MLPELRKRFNARFTAEQYQTLLQRLDAGCGAPVAFRTCETPCFFSSALLAQMAATGRDLILQLMNDPAYLADSQQTVPPAYRVPREDRHPLFVQVDFGLDAQHQPRLVEIQGFPSLYAYQPFLAETYRQVYGLDGRLGTFLGDLDAPTYEALLRQAIVGDHDPENVILLEIEPRRQKTLVDFLQTERLCGITTVCLTEIRKQGARLFYPRQGRLVPVERIYNRVIVEELAHKEGRAGFDFRDDLDVEWAGHPNWYYRISKFSLPYLTHPCVPNTQFLDRVTELPEDLENVVLKPLYAFAGLGVRVGPTREEIAAIADRSQYILQERVDFAPVIDTPYGKTKVEIRVMYLWRDELRAVTTLLRMGRGKMMGVDYNRNMEWVGASAAFTEDSS